MKVTVSTERGFVTFEDDDLDYGVSDDMELNVSVVFEGEEYTLATFPHGHWGYVTTSGPGTTAITYP